MKIFVEIKPKNGLSNLGHLAKAVQHAAQGCGVVEGDGRMQHAVQQRAMQAPAGMHTAHDLAHAGQGHEHNWWWREGGGGT